MRTRSDGMLYMYYVVGDAMCVSLGHGPAHVR
jgi:hypothetical protein